MKNEIIRLGQLTIRFLTESSDSNGNVAIFEFTVPVGAKVPLPHFHRDFDETIYGVAGELTLTVDGKTMELGVGEACFVPRGAVHGFINQKEADAKVLAIITPALLGPDYFKEIGALVNAGGPPNADAMKTVMTKHGLIPVMPQR